MAYYPGSGRGGFAPRKGRGGWNRPNAKKWEPVKLDTETRPLGELLKTVNNSELAQYSPGKSTSIDGCQYVASYNWLDDASATIVLPGRPPRWTPLQVPQRLKEDSGQYFRDPNAARCPEYPMAPVVTAVLQGNLAFDTGRVDLFACGSTMGNLLRFVRGVDKPFRFNVQTIGNTVFFVRKENDPRELIEGVRGFGHTFPEAYTTWDQDVRGSETHQRIVQYGFAGLKCLVRFEVDGYLENTEAVAGSPSKLSDDDLTQFLGNTAISAAPVTSNTDKGSFITQHRGTEVPQSSIFDLKTRSGRYKKEIEMSDMYPILWIKQIPNFIIAYHDGAGLFQDIRVQDVRADVQAWEEDNKDKIRQLSTLLNKIIDFARNDSSALLEVISQEVNVLEIRRQHGEGTQVLPAALEKQWLATHGGVSLSDDGAYDGLDAEPGASYKSDEEEAAGSEDDEPDYTACSAEDCGYCGKCTY